MTTKLNLRYSFFSQIDEKSLNCMQDVMSGWSQRKAFYLFLKVLKNFVCWNEDCYFMLVKIMDQFVGNLIEFLSSRLHLLASRCYAV